MPYVQYRDKRLFYKTAEVEEESKGFQAIDDGGIQCTRTQFIEETQFNDDFQIAILEAKGDFQKVIDGVPVLTDELLAQVVGEALALRLSQTRSLHGKECISNVLAVYISL